MTEIHNHAGIYRLRVERPSGPKFYIGQAAILRKRRTQHLRDLRRGRHKNQLLQRAFQKYGEGAIRFEILIVCQRSKSVLDLYEQSVLDVYRDDEVYNLCRECVGSKLGHPMSEETKLKIGTANRGRQLNDSQKQAVAASNKARNVSEETRAKMSASRIGNQNSLGHVQSAEHRAKVGAFFRGKKKSAEEVARRQATRLANRIAACISRY